MEELLTIEQVSERLKVDDETTRRWLVAGKIKGIKIGGKLWRVKEADLQLFLNGNGKSA